jgi:hypothetical protein
MKPKEFLDLIYYLIVLGLGIGMYFDYELFSGLLLIVALVYIPVSITFKLWEELK